MNPIYLFRSINGTTIEKDTDFIKKEPVYFGKQVLFLHFLSTKQQQLFPETYLCNSVSGRTRFCVICVQSFLNTLVSLQFKSNLALYICCRRSYDCFKIAGLGNPGMFIGVKETKR